MRERIKKEPPKQSYQINQVKSNRIARDCQMKAYKLRSGGRQWLIYGMLEQYGPYDS